MTKDISREEPWLVSEHCSIASLKSSYLGWYFSRTQAFSGSELTMYRRIESLKQELVFVNRQFKRPKTDNGVTGLDNRAFLNEQINALQDLYDQLRQLFGHFVFSAQDDEEKDAFLYGVVNALDDYETILDYSEGDLALHKTQVHPKCTVNNKQFVQCLWT